MDNDEINPPKKSRCSWFECPHCNLVVHVGALWNVGWTWLCPYADMGPQIRSSSVVRPAGSLGYGAIFKSNWFSGAWSNLQHLLVCVRIYITVKEIYGVLNGLWGRSSSYSTAQIYINCADAFYTHIRVSIYAHTHIVIRTYVYVYTHISVCLYAHTHIVICTYPYMYTRIYTFTCKSDVSLLFRTKTFLCVWLLWKRKSLKK